MNSESQFLQNFYLGIDLGTSFIKVAFINQNQDIIDVVKEPQIEMQIISQKQNYSQQDPQLWWKNTSKAIRKIMLKHHKTVIKGIGISYQMHGLVLIDKNCKILRNSIIWSDGRTKKIGDQLQNLINQNEYQKRSLNNSGDFTLSKLKWVQQNQPEIFQKVHKFMLPGDYIAFKLTGECFISQTGLSQGVMWDFQHNTPFTQLLQKAKIPLQIMPKVVKSFSYQVYRLLYNFFKQKTYDELNQIALNFKSDDIIAIPFGNGPQRMLNNCKVNFNIKNMDLNRHTANNIIRATVQAIAFSFVYGIKILKNSSTQQLSIKTIKAASDNLFKCQIICEIIATLLSCTFQIYETTGAVGCAIGAKFGHKMYEQKSQFLQPLIKKTNKLKQIKSKPQKKNYYQKIYDEWQKELDLQILLAQQNTSNINNNQ